MKFIIHKKTKKYLLFFLIIFTGLTGFFIFRTLITDQTAKQEIVVYESVCEPKLNYQVILIPNEVYSKLNQGEGLNYSKKLLSYIQAEYGIDYKGSAEVPLDIEYQIVAKVNSYSGSEKEKILNWSKSFPITAKKKESVKSGIWKKSETVNFPLSAYDSFAVRAEEITGMKGSTEVDISMTGKVIAHHEKEKMETPFEASLRIPLMEDVFKVEKVGTEPISKNITVTEQMPVPRNKAKLILYGIIMIFCIASLILVLFFSREPNSDEILMKKVNNIIKNYGSRIVALHSMPRIIYKQQYETHSMKDLIKISDDLQKPILYETDELQIVKNYQFHIVDEDILYTWRLE